MSRTRLAKAPYDRHGNLINYVGTVEPHEWRENKPFQAMLTLDGITRGMSAARFVWHSDKGRRYEMFMTDAVGLMQGPALIYAGSVDSWWMVQKRGKNYGIRLADQDDLKRAGHISGPKADCSACEGVTYGYESWCPLWPSPEKPHQFRNDPLGSRKCLCGEMLHHDVHGLN